MVVPEPEQIVERDGRGVEVALRLRAAELDEDLGLPLGLHALGHDLEAEPAGEPDDAGDDGHVVAVGVELGRERAVDLHRVDGEAPEVAERRVAGPEVVDREADAELADRVERLDRGVELVEDRVLGDLDAEAARVDTLLPSTSRMRSTRSRWASAWRDVDVDGSC